MSWRSRWLWLIRPHQSAAFKQRWLVIFNEVAAEWNVSNSHSSQIVSLCLHVSLHPPPLVLIPFLLLSHSSYDLYTVAPTSFSLVTNNIPSSLNSFLCNKSGKRRRVVIQEETLHCRLCLHVFTRLTLTVCFYIYKSNDVTVIRPGCCRSPW